MSRGYQIDRLARNYVANDPTLNLDGLPNKGPDFIDPVSGHWWDMTTTGQWQKHFTKYSEVWGEKARHLNTSY